MIVLTNILIDVGIIILLTQLLLLWSCLVCLGLWSCLVFLVFLVSRLLLCPSVMVDSPDLVTVFT